MNCYNFNPCSCELQWRLGKARLIVILLWGNEGQFVVFTLKSAGNSMDPAVVVAAAVLLAMFYHWFRGGRRVKGFHSNAKGSGKIQELKCHTGHSGYGSGSVKGEGSRCLHQGERRLCCCSD